MEAEETDDADPMAALEGAGAAMKGPSFVAATRKTGTEAPAAEVAQANPDESE